METYFASPERLDKKQVLEQSEIIKKDTFTTTILNAIPDMVVVVNIHRQVIFANRVFLDMIEVTNFEDALGQRPGELISCIYAHETTSGCGTARNCRYCGAVLTVLESQKTNEKTTGEARITTKSNGKNIPFDLMVFATPLEIDSEEYTLVVLKDISNIKRREFLERSFLHDIINSTWALANRIDLFPVEGMSSSQQERCIKIKDEIKKIMDEIEAQRDLIRIESEEIVIKLSSIKTLNLVSSAVNTISTHKVTQNRKILIDDKTVNIEIFTDSRILQRVLINLLKNALEASNEDEVTEIGCRTGIDNHITFWVKNNYVMSEEMKSQIFQRSFSTRGKGRGMGTYSVKLLVEQYLQGKVSFDSSNETKTIFYVDLPVKIEPKE